jgi:hypothetical protein
MVIINDLANATITLLTTVNGWVITRLRPSYKSTFRWNASWLRHELWYDSNDAI